MKSTLSSSNYPERIETHWRRLEAAVLATLLELEQAVVQLDKVNARTWERGSAP